MKIFILIILLWSISYSVGAEDTDKFKSEDVKNDKALLELRDEIKSLANRLETIERSILEKNDKIEENDNELEKIKKQFDKVKENNSELKNSMSLLKEDHGIDRLIMIYLALFALTIPISLHIYERMSFSSRVKEVDGRMKEDKNHVERQFQYFKDDLEKIKPIEILQHESTKLLNNLKDIYKRAKHKEKKLNDNHTKSSSKIEKCLDVSSLAAKEIEELKLKTRLSEELMRDAMFQLYELFSAKNMLEHIPIPNQEEKVEDVKSITEAEGELEKNISDFSDSNNNKLDWLKYGNRCIIGFDRLSKLKGKLSAKKYIENAIDAFDNHCSYKDNSKVLFIRMLLFMRKAQCYSSNHNQHVTYCKRAEQIRKSINIGDLDVEKKEYYENYLALLNRLSSIKGEDFKMYKKRSRDEAIRVVSGINIKDFDINYSKGVLLEAVKVLGDDPNDTRSGKLASIEIDELGRVFDFIKESHSEEMPYQFWFYLNRVYLSAIPRVIGFVEDDICYSFEKSDGFWLYLIKSIECLTIANKMNNGMTLSIDKDLCFVLLVSIVIDKERPDISLFKKLDNNSFLNMLISANEEKHLGFINYIISTCEWQLIFNEYDIVSLRYLAEAYYIRSSLIDHPDVDMEKSKTYMKRISDCKLLDDLPLSELFDFNAFYMKIYASLDDEHMFDRYLNMNSSYDVDEDCWYILLKSKVFSDSEKYMNKITQLRAISSPKPREFSDQEMTSC